MKMTMFFPESSSASSSSGSSKSSMLLLLLVTVGLSGQTVFGVSSPSLSLLSERESETTSTSSLLRSKNNNQKDDNEDDTIIMNNDEDVELGYLEMAFQQWMMDFKKEYKTIQEQMERFEIWMENHVFIHQHNSQSFTTFQVGHNQFSDLTVEEYQQYNKLGMYSPGVLLPPSTPTSLSTSTTITSRRNLLQDDNDIPSSMNWVEKGAIPPVKNQGMCGSCWAFSAIGSIEGQHYLDTGSLIPLSEQQLIDCDKLDLGCGGGLMDNAFLFDENSTGICSEVDYPYAGHKRWFRGCGSMKGECEPIPHTRVKSFKDVPNTINDLKFALSKQPVSVAIQADLQSFQFYKSGIYSDVKCEDKLDHGVLAVGYGTDDTTGLYLVDQQEEDLADPQELDYFLVRNSWGATWGDAGYIKMAQHSPHVNGTCGILAAASRPALRDDTY